MAEAAAAVAALASAGVVRLNEKCSVEGCRLTAVFECPSCKARYCQRHASDAAFTCVKCGRKLAAAHPFSVG
ncbi:MAG: hypothetical protein QW587_01435 [Candidatus Bathyarchaeia archaeon]